MQATATRVHRRLDPVLTPLDSHRTDWNRLAALASLRELDSSTPIAATSATRNEQLTQTMYTTPALLNLRHSRLGTLSPNYETTHQ